MSVLQHASNKTNSSLIMASEIAPFWPQEMAQATSETLISLMLYSSVSHTGNNLRAFCFVVYKISRYNCLKQLGVLF